jgi:hypothetical protein
MAITGFIDGGVCYSNWYDAYIAHFAKISSVILPNGDTVFYSEISGTVFRIVDSALGVRTSVPASAPTFSMCDPIVGFTDGMTFAMICVGLIASASMFALISRAK